MYCIFIKSILVEVEETSMIDGCNPIQTFFKVVILLLKPITILIKNTLLQELQLE